MVFEVVGFEHNRLLTLKNWKCGDSNPKADIGKGFTPIITKHHIPKHHIPEHPIHAHWNGWDM